MRALALAFALASLASVAACSKPRPATPADKMPEPEATAVPAEESVEQAAPDEESAKTAPPLGADPCGGGE